MKSTQGNDVPVKIWMNIVQRKARKELDMEEERGEGVLGGGKGV